MSGVLSLCSSGYELSLLDPAASTDSDSEFEPSGRAGRKKRRGKHSATSSDFVRMTSRKKGVVSYKESSHSDLSGDGAAAEEDGEGAGEMEDDNRDAIERVIRKRNRGKLRWD